MPAKHQGLDRVNQRLDAQDHGVHEPDRIHPVQGQPLQDADLAGGVQLVIAGISVGDAGAAGCDAVEEICLRLEAQPSW
jgi:hypothetical protein